MIKEVKRYNFDVDKFGSPRAYESEHGRWVRRDDYDALLAERDRLRETLKGFPGFLCGTATGDKWIEQKRAALQGEQP